MDEMKQIVEWIRKNNPDAEVIISDKPEAERLRDTGWERLPFTWRDQQIWIKRKPVSDQRKMQECA